LLHAFVVPPQVEPWVLFQLSQTKKDQPEG
jgi:hypothetical protein